MAFSGTMKFGVVQQKAPSGPTGYPITFDYDDMWWDGNDPVEACDSTNVQVNCEGSWTLSESASWFSLSTYSGTGNTAVTISVQVNSGGSRFDTITGQCGSYSDTVIIHQWAVGNSCT